MYVSREQSRFTHGRARITKLFEFELKYTNIRIQYCRKYQLLRNIISFICYKYIQMLYI